MLRLTGVIGSTEDPDLAAVVRRLEEVGGAEYVVLEPADVARRRMRLTTDAGTECLISLPRGADLRAGAVLLLDPDRAIVVRVSGQKWVRLRAVSRSDALQLGFMAGHLHWKVRFVADAMFVACHGNESEILARLRHLIDEGRVQWDSDEHP